MARTNSNKLLIAQVPVKDGKAMVDGDYAIEAILTGTYSLNPGLNRQK
jgi:2-methylaconitate cis-trans-isomerase PrpF